MRIHISLNRVNVRTVLLLCLSSMVLVSCHYKGFDDEGFRHNLQIRFLWDEAPKAEPESMIMYVFSGEAQPVVLPFEDINGGPAVLPPSDYQFIAMNDGTELLTSGTSFESFQVFAPETSLPTFSRIFASNRAVPLAEGTEEQRYFLQPEWLQTDGIDHMMVTMETDVVEFMMHEAVKSYYFIIRNVDNLTHVNDITATLSGMSESWRAGYGTCTDTQCMIPFEMEVGTDNTVSGRVQSFGHCPSSDIHRHLLTVYFLMDNGQKLYMTIDVTDQLHEDEHWNGGDTPIIVEGLPLPYSDDPAAGGMFNPEVGDWIDVEEEIEL